MRFTDREDAGEQLADTLKEYGGRAVVYGLPRGGVVVAEKVARALKAPLDMILVRKIGHPTNPEYAVGAIAEGSEPIFDESARTDIDEPWMQHAIQNEMLINRQRRHAYFPPDFHHPKASGKTVIIVDDGMATGYTMVAAVESIQKYNPREIIVAVPVASARSVRMLQAAADRVVVLGDPALFYGAVGAHFDDFPQVTDDEVIKLFRAFY